MKLAVRVITCWSLWFCLLGSTTSFAQVCTQQRTPASGSSAGVLSRIQLPGNQAIYFLGRIHGNFSDIHRDFRRWLRLSKASPRDFLQGGRRLLKKYSNVLKSREKNLEIIDPLLKTGALDFLGLEMSKKEFQIWKRITSENHAMLVQEFSRRGISSHPLFKKIQLVVLGEALAWQKQNPSSQLTVKSLEGNIKDQLRVRKIYNQEFYRANAQKFKRTLAHASLSSVERIKAEKVFVQITGLYQDWLRGRTNYIDDWIRPFRQNIRTVLRDTLGRLRPFYQTLWQRDKAVVDKILQSSDSGLVFFGGGHIDSLSEMLMEKCRQKSLAVL